MRSLLVARSNPAGDPRPRRMLSLLKELGSVWAVSAGDAASLGVERLLPVSTEARPLPAKLLAAAQLAVGAYEAFLWDAEMRRLRDALAAERFDVVVCHDLDLLPLAQAVAGEAPVLFDAREYYPRQFEHSAAWRLLFGRMNAALCAKYLPRCAAVMTVSPGLAREYEREFGVGMEVVRSLPDPVSLSPSPVDGEAVRIVHHGNASPNRRIEAMIEAVRLAGERFSLDLMLMPSDEGYLERLRAQAAATDNVRIVPPVPHEGIVERLGAYDMGMFLVEPTTFNLRHTLPNKFYEFIQARLAVAVGPSPDMAQELAHYGCGVVSADFSPAAMAETLRGLTPQSLTAMKERAHEAAASLHTGTSAEQIRQMLRRVGALGKERA